MKKLYGKGKVHPSPAPDPVGGHLALLCHLPAAILALTAALSAEDREVLAYLISGTSRLSDGGRERSSRMKRKENKKEHPPLFHCACFRCYMSFWVRWDSSPNRQLIHEILDAVEAALDYPPPPQKRRPEKRGQEQVGADEESWRGADAGATEAEGDEIGVSGDEEDVGSVRRFMSFIGDKIWGVWN